MKTIERPARHPSVYRLLLTAALAAGIASGASAQQTVWTGGAGNWSDASKWSYNVPNSADSQADIDGSQGVNSVVMMNGFYTVGGLTITSGDALDIVSGETFTITGAGNITGAGTITNNGTITVGTPDSATLALAGDIMLDGTGTLTFPGGDALNGPATLTIASGQTLDGATIAPNNLGNSQTNFVNHGTINANSSGNALIFNPGPNGLTNTGLLEASGGGILDLANSDGIDGPYINTGTISALAGSTVELTGANLSGGTLSTVGTGTILIYDATLSDLTNTGTLALMSGTELDMTGTITNNGTITVGTTSPGNATFALDGNLTLNGTGTVTFIQGDTLNGAGTLTIASGQTLEGATINNDLGNTQTNFVNHGTINANSPGAALKFQPGANGLINTGLLKASGGGVLDLDGNNGDTGPYSNTGTISALAASTVELSAAARLSGGALSTVGTGTILILDATLSDLTNTGALFVMSGDELTMSGTITNNGTITIGTTSPGNATFAVNGNLTLDGTGTVTFLEGDTLNGAGTVTIASGQTLEGATIDNNLGGLQASFVNHGTIDANSSGNLLTFDPGSGGLSSDGTLEASGGGILRFDGNNGNAGPYTNNGTISALAGSTVQLTGGADLTNLANDTLTGGTFQAVADSSGTMATLDFAGATFTTNNADIILSGTNSVFAAAAPLSVNKGSFSLLGLRDFTTAGALSNEGTITLDAGCTLHVAGHFMAAGAAATLAVTLGGAAKHGAKSPGILQANGTATLSGDLSLTFAPGAVLPVNGDALTILSAGAPIVGSFANVRSGGRLPTTDGRGSFRVIYGSGTKTVVLSEFLRPGKKEIKVNISAPVHLVTAKSGHDGEFLLRLSPAPSSDVAVKFTLKGSAIDGTDYALLKDTVVIKAGKTSEPIRIVPRGDLDGATEKTVVLTLRPGAGYQVGADAKATVTIKAP